MATSAARRILVSYMLETAQGATNVQEETPAWVDGDEQVEWEPDHFPPGVTEWWPVIRDKFQKLRRLQKRKKGQKARVNSDDPAEIDEDTRPIGDPRGPDDPTANADRDDSGIDPPDSALADVTTIGEALPLPGDYEFRLTKFVVDPDDDRQDETPTGPPATITIAPAGGYYIRVHPPRDYRNWLTNAEAKARGNDAARTPEGWQRPAAAGVTFYDDEPGVSHWEDFTESTADVTVEIEPILDVAEQPTITNRKVIEVSDYESGDVDHVLRQWLSGGGFVDTVMDTINASGVFDLINSIGPVGVPNLDFYWASNVTQAQFLTRLVGSRPNGGKRRLRAKRKHSGVSKGKKKHPRKRRKQRRRAIREVLASLLTQAPPPAVVPAEEEPAAPYPTFGYTAVVEDPPTSERPIWDAGAGTYVPGNYVEYYGPEGMPVTSTFFMGGLKMPVKAEEQWTDSFHFFWQGADQAATPLRLVLKDKNHRVIQDLGTFEGMSGITGESKDQPDADVNGWVRRKITYSVPLDDPTQLTGGRLAAAYVEIIPGGVGDGLFRVMGGQHERGPTMTSFSIAHALSATLTNTFDLSVPGVPRGSMATLSGIRRFVKIGAEVTHAEPFTTAGNEEPITSHVTTARTRRRGDPQWSPWTSDPALLPVPRDRGQLQIQTTLTTPDANVAAELHSHFVDFERELPLGRGYGSLTRRDGTEFDGGVVVFDFPPVRRQRPVVVSEAADGTRDFAEMGKSTRWARGWGFECYLERTAEEIMALQGEEGREGMEDEDASVFCVEYLGKRYAARILDAEVLPTDRDRHLPLEGMEDQGQWFHQATGVEAEILGEEPF